MTELSFLIDLLLNHKLPKATRDAVAERIKVVEACSHPVRAAAPPSVTTHNGIPQAPSTLAAMARHGATNVFPVAATVSELPPEPQPVAVVAQTPAAVAAVNSREQSIQQARSGKPFPGETKPRKF